MEWRPSWESIIHHFLDWPLVFLNEILTSTIKFIERLFKLQGYIALWQKSIHQALVAISKTIIVWAASCISYELWNVYIICRVRWYVAGKEWKIDNVEVKLITFVIYLHCLWWMWDQCSLPGDLIWQLSRQSAGMDLSLWGNPKTSCY